MFRHFAPLCFLWFSLSASAFAMPEQWVQVSSPHFTVITNSSDVQGRHVLDQFERMRWLFQTLFPRGKAAQQLPIVVIAVRNQKTFQTLEPAAYLAKGALNLDGYFLQTPDRSYILVRLDAQDEHPFAAIYHEYTHFQFSDALEWMPLWLNEGFAEFFQNTEIRKKDVFLGETNADDILYLRSNRLLPLETLFKVDAQSPYYHEENKGSVFYAESWALTHYLEVTDHGQKTNRLDDYLKRVARHEDALVAAQAAFGDLKKLQSSLDSYIRSSSYKQFVLSSAAAPLDEASYKSTALTQPQADAVRADLLVNVQRTQEARALLDAVLKSDPDNEQACETMGYLALRDGNREEARKWFEKAVKLNAQSYLANYYFAIMSMGSGVLQNHQQIEASLRAAIQLNPAFAPAYDQLASLFAMRHENLDEAHMLNIQAIQLDPASVHYRLNAASVLMTMSRYTDAAAVLRIALKVAKTPGESTIVESRLKEVEDILALGAPSSRMLTAPATQVNAQSAEKIVVVKPVLKHPTEPLGGPVYQALGVIRNVQCSYPAVIEFQVISAKKTISLYSNNLFKIDLSVLGFTPNGDMSPCRDFEGFKAQVKYAASSDKTVDGQIIAVVLMK